MSDIVLFHPYVPRNALAELEDTLNGRWIGQGPKVDEFERRFRARFAGGNECVATGSGTDALHLAYILAGIESGDEVIAPVFTCAATNIPLLYLGAEIRFADIQKDSMNISPSHVAELISDRTKAIVCVDYGGDACDLDELNDLAEANGITLVEDAAQSLGATYKNRPVGSIADFTTFSFQAVKHITTGDGGMLSVRNTALKEKADRLRWFGIDRKAKTDRTGQRNIDELGYKYQMSDIAASIGLAALEDFDKVLNYRKMLLQLYKEKLNDIPGLNLLCNNSDSGIGSAWLCTIAVDNRKDLEERLKQNKIESAQVHYRNDKYKIFEKHSIGRNFPNMDFMEDKYLLLPLHCKLQTEDVERVCAVIRDGW